MDNQKISIIIPVYNVEKYLKQCLDSVIGQTLQDIEIICINDGSTDNSLKILQEYAQKCNKLKIFSTKNSGLACTRNFGIEKAKGKYLFFLDSDDYLASENVFELLYKKAIESKKDIIISRAIAFPETEDEFLMNLVKEKNDFLNYPDYNNVTVSENNFSDVIDKYPCTSWGCLYKTEFIKKNNLTFINKNVPYEDNGFFIKVISNFPTIECTNIQGIMYRIRHDSIITTKINLNKRRFFVKTVLDDAFQYINKIHSSKTSKKIIQKIKNTNNYYDFYHNIDIKGLFTYFWKKDYRVIKLFDFPLYREKYRDGMHVIKIMGLPIYKKPINTEKK